MHSQQQRTRMQVQEPPPTQSDAIYYVNIVHYFLKRFLYEKATHLDAPLDVLCLPPPGLFRNFEQRNVSAGLAEVLVGPHVPVLRCIFRVDAPCVLWNLEQQSSEVQERLILHTNTLHFEGETLIISPPAKVSCRTLLSWCVSLNLWAYFGRFGSGTWKRRGSGSKELLPPQWALSIWMYIAHESCQCSDRYGKHPFGVLTSLLHDLGPRHGLPEVDVVVVAVLLL